MVNVLSYIFAVIITAALAIILYPLAALFWVFGLLGKLSNTLFDFTKNTIATLWKDLKKSAQTTEFSSNTNARNTDTWLCSCGCSNSGKFCSECGAGKPEARQE